MVVFLFHFVIRLAERTQTTKSFISKIENGVITPSVGVFYRIIAALGMRVEVVKRLCIENYPMIVEDAMNEFICNRFDGVIGFNLVGMGLSFKLDTKDSLLIGQSADSIFPKLVRRN